MDCMRVTCTPIFPMLEYLSIIVCHGYVILGSCIARECERSESSFQDCSFGGCRPDYGVLAQKRISGLVDRFHDYAGLFRSYWLWSPIGQEVDGRVIRQPRLSITIGIHHIDLIVAVPVAGKSYLAVFSGKGSGRKWQGGGS